MFTLHPIYLARAVKELLRFDVWSSPGAVPVVEVEGRVATVHPVRSDSAGLEIELLNGEVVFSLTGGGSGGSPEWGDIIGTLADQTDLQDELDLKEDAGTAAAAVAAHSAEGDPHAQYLTPAEADALYDPIGEAAAEVAAHAALGDPHPGYLTPSEGNAAYQPLDSDLTTLAANITAFGHSLVDDANASAARTTLGLVPGTDVQAQDGTLTALAGLDASAGLVEQTGADAFTKRAIGVGAASSIPTRSDGDGRWQGLDSELTALAGLTSAADRLPYFTGSGTAALATFTSAARNLLDDADAAAMLATLGAQPADADLTALAAANNSAVLAATTASFLTADEAKLDGIATGATVGATWGVNITSQPSVVSQAEAEAGSATTERIWTAERVNQAIQALAPGGGGGGLSHPQILARTLGA